MGYELIRSMSFNLEKFEVNMSVASSNVTPRTYYKNTISGILNDYKNIESLSEIEKFLFPIINGVRAGVLKLQSSVSVKVRYTFHKVLEKIYELEHKHCIDLWAIRPSENNMNNLELEIVKKVVSDFLYFYNKENKIVSKKIFDEKGRFVKKINRRSLEIVYDKKLGKLYNKEKELCLAMEKLKNFDLKFNVVDV